MINPTAQEKFKDAMDAHVDLFMFSHGFNAYRRRKDDREYERWRGDYRDYLGIIFSKVRGHDAVEVTIGVAVGHRSIAEFWDGCLALAKFVDVKRPRCVGGELQLRWQGNQWITRVIDENVDAQAAGKYFCSEIRDHALPFFDEFHSLERVMEACRNLEMAIGRERSKAILAAAHSLRGEHEQGRAILQAELESAQRWYRNSPMPRTEQQLYAAQQMLAHFDARVARDAQNAEP